MKKLNKFFTIIMSMVMMISISVPAMAADLTSTNEIYYITYDKNGNVVDEGTIPEQNGKARYTWTGMKLENGYSTSFRMPNRQSFYVTDDTDMNFSYTLDQSAKLEYRFYRGSTSSPDDADVWKSGSKTQKSGTITKTANKTAYYYVNVTNASSDTIRISAVSFTF